MADANETAPVRVKKSILRNPAALAVTLCLAVGGILLTIALSIGGSYYLSLTAIHHQAAINAAATKERTKIMQQQKISQDQASIQGSVPVCVAFKKLSDVQGSHGTTSATYGEHLEGALKSVYASTHCDLLLRLVREKAPVETIIKDLRKADDGPKV